MTRPWINQLAALAGQVSNTLVTLSPFWNKQTTPGFNLDGSLGRRRCSPLCSPCKWETIRNHGPQWFIPCRHLSSTGNKWEKQQCQFSLRFNVRNWRKWPKFEFILVSRCQLGGQQLDGANSDWEIDGLHKLCSMYFGNCIWWQFTIWVSLTCSPSDADWFNKGHVMCNHTSVIMHVENILRYLS